MWGTPPSGHNPGGYPKVPNIPPGFTCERGATKKEAKWAITKKKGKKGNKERIPREIREEEGAPPIKGRKKTPVSRGYPSFCPKKKWVKGKIGKSPPSF